MQELNVQPTNPTPYTPAGGTYNLNPTPGAGGLPALSGLSRNVNPMAQELQAQGRGEDKMLVHMTPDEVNSLQGLAMHYGTTMTINPNTGLPEAGLLGNIFKKLIPTLLGGALAATGVGAPLAAGIVGLGSTALTGSLKKGLMAGLGAFGGASLAGAAGLGGSISKTGFGTLGSKAGLFGANMGSGTVGGLAQWNASNPSFFGRFAQTAKQGLPKIIGKAAPMLAVSGLMGTAGNVDRAIQQGGTKPQGPVEQPTWVNEGPYMPTRRRLAPRLTGPDGRGEIMYFDDPDFGGYLTASGQLRGVPTRYGQPTGYAEGGDTKAASTSTNAGGLSRQRQFQENLTNIGQKNWANAYYDFQKTLLDAVPTETRYALEVQVNDTIKDRAFKDVDEWKAYLNTVANAAIRPSTRGYEPNTTTTKNAGMPTNATADSYGVYTKNDTYVPQFTEVADFVTQRVTPYTGGSRETAKLADYIKSYETSPEAITASVGYAPGQSPTQRNRAYALQLAREEEARRKAAETGTNTTTTTTGTNVTTGTNTATNVTGTGTGTNTTGTTNFFFDPTTSAYFNNIGLTGDMYDFDPVTGTYRRRSPTGTNSGSGRGREQNDTLQLNAKGGSIRMDDGAFVVDARTVSELGNGSSNAGQELLARLGGRPVKGPGDGVSDSIRANIGGRQEARVARDEVIFPAAAVKKLGGAKKLYALMDKAHKARKKAERGSDTQLRKGLGAL